MYHPFFLCSAYIPGGGRVNFKNVKHAIKMVSDYAYTGHVGLTADVLMRKRPELPTYFYHYGYSATHSFCDKEVYYGWKFSLKLQLQQLGFGMKQLILKMSPGGVVVFLGASTGLGKSGQAWAMFTFLEQFFDIDKLEKEKSTYPGDKIMKHLDKS